MKPERAFFSFSRVTDPSRHQDYAAWHQLDHLPENLALPGVITGERWVRTPACRAASGAIDGLPSAPAGGIPSDVADFGPDDGDYLSMYLFADPVADALANWNELAARSYNWGRRPEIAWTDRWMGFFVPIRGYAADRVLVSPEALPFRPKKGVYVTVTEAEGLNTDLNTLFQWYDEVRIPDLLDCPGVAGAWTFTSLDTFAGNHGAEAPNRTLRLHLYFLDDEPLAVQKEISSRTPAWAADGRDLERSTIERRLFDSMLETIQPWKWDWFS